MNSLRIAVIALAAAAAAFPQTAAEPPAAFQELRPQPRAAAAGGAGFVRRLRAAGADTRLFDREAAKAFAKGRGGRTRMNLFPDLTLVVDWQSAVASPSGAMVWAGSVAGDPLSQATVVVSGGEMTGNITAGGSIYEIRPGSGGEHWIREVDASTLPREGEPKRLPAEPSVEPHAVAADAARDDDGTVIDVLVVYTPAARQAAGGEDKMRQLIELGVAETNQGYANSRVNHRIRLAGTSEVNYRESGDSSVDLDRLTAPADGVIDEVHALRDRTGADLVSLWVEKTDACGVAWVLQNPSRPSPERGFNVIQRDCATGYFSFGHEIGHNLGANHATEDNSGEGAFPYSNGFKQTTRAPYFRSVMAYDCPGGCQRINYWSSPDNNYQGSALGERGRHDNRATLNNTAAIVAGYRRASSTGVGAPAAPPAPAAGTLPESAHPYSNNFDRTWTYSVAGNPASIHVTFSSDTYVEEDWDYIFVTDGEGRRIAGSPFTGAELAGKTVTVPGATVRIRLVTDESETFYGFRVTGIAGSSGSKGGQVDLVTVSFTANTTATPGGKLTGLVARVQNQGQAAAGAFRTAFYWVSENKEAVYSGWNCNASGLGAGLQSTCSGDIGIPASMKPGKYYIVAVADDEKKNADANWDNNAKASEAGVVTIQ